MLFYLIARLICCCNIGDLTSNYEVDFILGDKIAIEVKGTDLVTDKHLKGLRALKEEGKVKSYGVISLDMNDRMTSDGIHIWSWKAS